MGGRDCSVVVLVRCCVGELRRVQVSSLPPDFRVLDWVQDKQDRQGRQVMKLIRWNGMDWTGMDWDWGWIHNNIMVRVNNLGLRLDNEREGSFFWCRDGRKERSTNWEKNKQTGKGRSHTLHLQCHRRIQLPYTNHPTTPAQSNRHHPNTTDTSHNTTQTHAARCISSRQTGNMCQMISVSSLSLPIISNTWHKDSLCVCVFMVISRCLVHNGK